MRYVHLGKKAFTSEICGKVFLISINLQRHIIAVHWEKAFTCKFCERIFLLIINLQRPIIGDHLEKKPLVGTFLEIFSYQSTYKYKL